MKKAQLYTYDLEVFPNYFSCAIKNRLDSSIKIFEIGKVANKEFTDLTDLVTFIKDKDKWMIGYYSKEYDDRLMCAIIQMYDQLLMCLPLEQAIQIHQWSKLLIDAKDKRSFRDSHKFFNSLDMMRMGMKGNVMKSLKLLAVNLKWDKIQDLPYKPHDRLKSIAQVEELKRYNINDVEITDKLYDIFRDAVRLRQYITSKYNVYVMNDPDSVIADKLLSNMYYNATNTSWWDIKDLRSPREVIKLKDCIDPRIKFQTKSLQNFLSELKRSVISESESIEKRVLVGSTYYDIAQGGIHSVRPPAIFVATDDIMIADADVESFYPNIIDKLNIYPEHLGEVFVDLVRNITKERLQKKADWKAFNREMDDLAQKSLKITINAIFGKLGFEHGWLYDPKALYSVTLNGQLFLLMLIERLEMENFSVFYANTDGITAFVPKDRLDRYKFICEGWQKFTKFNLDFDYSYKKCIILNVNNYLIIKDKHGVTEVKAKGMLDNNAWKDISNKKAFNMPIIAHALHEYWVNGKDITETIKNHKDLHDFCMAVKVGDGYDAVHFERMDYSIGTLIQEEVQKTNRYFVVGQAKYGGTLYKTQYRYNSTEIKKQDRIIAGEYLCLANDMNNLPDGVEPKYAWYIKECIKIIRTVENEQLSLF